MNIVKRITDRLRTLPISHTLRLNISLALGLSLNLIYIVGNLASAFIYKSVWSATVVLYHLTLIVIRLYLLSTRGSATRRGGIGSVCLRVGLLLLLLDLTSAFMMLYTVRRGSFVRYSGIILLGFVVYALYACISSVAVMKRREGESEGLLAVAKSISLSTALMSIFNLQYSLLLLIGANMRLVARIVMLVGVAVFFVMLSLSVGLIRFGFGGSKK